MKRRSKESRKRNLNAHQRAIANPQVKAAFDELNRVWDQIDPIERGERLLRLAKQGCSTGGLGEALGKSATNIRRHMKIALLPEEERAVIKAGASAKRILEKKALADKRSKMRERVATDKKTGEFSNRIADTILEFCRTVNGMPETPIREYDMELFMSETRNAMRGLESLGAKAAKFPKRFNLRKRFKLTRPPDKDDNSWMGDPSSESWMAHRANWLANLLLTEAAESPIRHKAIDSADRRSEELRIKIKLTWKEASEQKIAHAVWVLQGPPIRKRWY